MNNKDTLSKAELRSGIIKRRKLLSEDEVREMSGAIHSRLRMLDFWRDAQEVMLYWRTRNEVDTKPLFEELRERDVRVLFPRCREGSPGIMDAAPVSCETELREGRYSIMEPDSRICSPAEGCTPDAVIVPGVAFGRGGYRLGYGGGYYDRFLARPNLSGAVTAGLAYSFQLVPGVPAEEWDLPVDVIITEEETVWINRRK